MFEAQRSVLSEVPLLHEVVIDRGHLDDGRPREGVFMEQCAGVMYLRPIGGGIEWTTRADQVSVLSPREIAPGAGARSRRRLLNDEPA
ncbi:hypothetical protein PUR71_37760 [Streptomyces sp. SP17BM10]|uniref:hypothetical protein n=1 Tax=Streptomyces sp. SP17BM10 TaxID=3002530 RepID=UPI002E79513D|nr:hypothetical protein [Streptomyces sp. SP17BM10]MEE1788608.1 hypothetical protein [Streptomyces sp. SP17BM10]